LENDATTTTSGAAVSTFQVEAFSAIGEEREQELSVSSNRFTEYDAAQVLCAMIGV